jgi:hypothetical protein
MTFSWSARWIAHARCWLVTLTIPGVGAQTTVTFLRPPFAAGHDTEES